MKELLERKGSGATPVIKQLIVWFGSPHAGAGHQAGVGHKLGQEGGAGHQDREAGPHPWSRSVRTIISLLAFSPPLSVFWIVFSISRMCPQCVAREVGDLLPALVKFVYQLSWREQQGHNSGASVSLASVCILELATCDPEAARLLCHDLENLPPVNPTFDTLVTEILSVVTAV